MSTKRHQDGVDLSCGGVARRPENVTNGCREVTQPGAWNNNCIPPAVSFLGDPQEFSPLVLAKLEMKPFPFYLNFFRFENAVHFEHSGEFIEVAGRIGSKFY